MNKSNNLMTPWVTANQVFDMKGLPRRWLREKYEAGKIARREIECTTKLGQHYTKMVYNLEDIEREFEAEQKIKNNTKWKGQY